MPSKPGNIDQSVNKGDVISSGTGQPGSGRVEAGRIYTGTIVATHHGDNIYEVQLDAINAKVKCIWACGIFAPMLGIRMKYYPPLQTKVAILCSSASKGWIITTAPKEPFDTLAAKAKSMVEMGLGDLDLDPYISDGENAGREQTVTKPNDLLEGEFEISNNFGVAVQFLTTMVKLQGSERAKIEAFLMDDMVRIVSETFKHYSCFGDYQIYNDGRLNVRWDGTSYEHESFGKASKDDPLVELNNKKVEFEDTYNQTGRWRFSEYIGFLGDFIHTFVTEPHEALASIAEEAIRPGKARTQIQSDGTILMQSVAEIALERVCRVVAPVEKRRQDDPEGVKKDQFENLNKDYLKLWNNGQDMRKAHYASYQLRQYARWLSCYHSFARFHQMSADWTIPKETDFEHSWGNKEDDVEAANAGQELSYDVYATIRILRDGSILVMDGFNSTVSMVRGNIQMSAARHITLDAAGDIHFNAGQNIYMKARRNIEISAIRGGLILKARAWWKGFCEWGSVWIKSDAVDPAKDEPPAPEDPEQDPEPEVRAAAIFIDAAKGQTIIQSERRITVATNGTPDDGESMDDTTASVVLQSRRQDVRMLGKRHAIIKSEGQSEGQVIIDAERSKAVIVKCLKFLMDVKQLFDINSKLTFKRDNILRVEEIRNKRSHSAQIITGPENLGVDHVNDKIPHHGHGHHLIKYNPTTTPVEFATGDEVEELTAYSPADVVEVEPHSENGDPPDGPDWEYPKEDKKFDNMGYVNQPTEDEIFQPMAQQRLYESGTDLLIKKDDYEEWVWATDNKLKSGKRTNTASAPFPGITGQEKRVTAGAPLHAPLDEEYSAQSPDKAQDPVNNPVTRKFLKYS